MKKLENKIALVTGGNSGIGLATAKLFREQGAQVIITARSTETFEQARKEYGSAFDIVQTDVSRTADLDRLFAHIKNKYKALDVLFANAGIGQFRPTSETDEAVFDSQFNTNVRGLYFTVQKALPLFRPGSSVILNASVAAIKGFAGSSVYSATKAAVRSFARSWTAEIPPAQVRFNVLSPGPIETPIFGKMGLTREQFDAFANDTKSKLPIQRFGAPEEMANVALFLASSDSSYICGSDILADGGLGNI